MATTSLLLPLSTTAFDISTTTIASWKVASTRDVGINTATKTPDGKHYVVNGYKKWITGMPIATHMTTAVRTGGPGMGGISVLVIPVASKGFTWRRIPNSGQNGGGASFVELDNVKVPVGKVTRERRKVERCDVLARIKHMKMQGLLVAITPHAKLGIAQGRYTGLSMFYRGNRQF